MVVLEIRLGNKGLLEKVENTLLLCFEAWLYYYCNKVVGNVKLLGSSLK